MGAIPGTREHEAMYGMSGAHRTVEQAKGYIPGRFDGCGGVTHLTLVLSL